MNGNPRSNTGMSQSVKVSSRTGEAELYRPSQTLNKPLYDHRNDLIIGNFPTDYRRKDDIYYKKDLLDRTLSDQTNSELFQVILQCLCQESEDCYYRLDLFEYFILSAKMKSRKAYNSFFQSSTLLSEFISNSPYLEYIDTIISELSVNESSLLKLQKSALVQKIASMSFEDKITKLYVIDVERFMNFKENNPNRPYNVLGEERLFFLRKVAQKIFHLLRFVSKELEPDLIHFILIRLLLIIQPQSEIQDYALLHDIGTFLANITSLKNNDSRTSDILLKDLLVTIINALKINYLPEDNFVGYSNLAIAIELVEPKELVHCVEKYFIDIMQIFGGQKEALGKFFENLISANFTRNTCSLIRLFVESCLVNLLFDQLFYIFHTNIIPHLVPKLRVDRALVESLPLTSFFFFGFGKIPYELPETLCDDFTELLQIRIEICERNPRDIQKKNQLRDYLDFMEGVCYLYTDYYQNRVWCSSFIQQMRKVRKDFNFGNTSYELKAICEGAQGKVWQISAEDLKNNMSLVDSTDSFHPMFNTSYKYKGIKNIGNTCYLACIMQALFGTKEFREKIISLVPEAIQTSPLRLKDKGDHYGKVHDILRETQYLFTQLDSKSTDSKCGDIQGFREALPDQFRFANEEQDASEFLKIYLDILESRLKPTSEKELVDKCFAGNSETTLECSKCSTKKKRQEKFLDIVLNFDENKEHEILDELEMIRKGFEPEVLAEGIQCEKCKKVTPKTLKTTKLLKLPSYLIITLNRFKFEKVGVKLTTPVKIYQQIDSKQIVQDKDISSSQYNLYAVLVHIGPSAEHGHYYILIKDNESPNGWYLINDSQCKFAENIKLDDLFQENKLETPYILFYEEVKKQESFFKKFF